MIALSQIANKRLTYAELTGRRGKRRYDSFFKSRQRRGKRK